MADGANLSGMRFGSLLAGTPTYDAEVRKREQAFGLLDRVCQALEPTETQMGRAKTSYLAVGEWLSADPELSRSQIYVQGSASHGTMVKPIDSHEHDVDLICLVSNWSRALPPAILKRIIGDRLRSHATYSGLLQEMQRCWRLNYAGEFHLDITPSVPNPDCYQGGELVPDKAVQDWKASNPIGFRNLFARRAALQPEVRVVSNSMDVRAEVKPFPVSSPVKGTLRRTVQLLKRHRDLEFKSRDRSLAPLSIIITALASKAYEFCVKNYPYDNELDLLCDTIRAMPWFIDNKQQAWGTEYVVANETTNGENFAEKWKSEPARRMAFHSWQAKALGDFEVLKDASGIDTVQRLLGPTLGEEPVRKALDSLTEELGDHRKSGSLIVKPGLGLVGIAGTASGTPVRANTFFGR
jgi:Second Messenger Oligonucleotide or Dinucleotide Synthetase domain